MKCKEYFSINKVLQLLLLSLLFIGFLSISGCTPISNLLFGPSGSLEVTTYPSGAKIFLNDKDTGYVTPYTITNLFKSTYEVKVILGDVSYTKTVIVYSDNTTSVYKDLLPRLNKIVVQPTSMNLEAGQSQKIDSITAYYIDSGSVTLALSSCSYSSSSNHATINSSGTVSAVSEGSAIITVSYTDTEMTKTDTVNIIVSSLKLTSIDVLPLSMNLDIGESKTISSITANFNDNSTKSLGLTNCNYSSSSSHATVNSSGTITGVSAGSATINVSYTDAEITKTDTVNITVNPIVTPVVYRALCIGVGDYLDVSVSDLESPGYNVNRIIQVLNSCKFGSEEIEFTTIETLKDENATKTAIINGITSTFSGADENDVSYFYFSGHGSYTGVFATSYICPTGLDGSVASAISVDELESALSAIPGTKVVILDSCFSGGFIGKGKEEKVISKENLTSFNDEIINVFSQAESKSLLTTNQYKVLTASHYDQTSYENTGSHPKDGYPYAIFTAAFCLGCGYNDGIYYADTDVNTKVSLEEEYNFIVAFEDVWFENVYYRQNVQVFPEDSNFTIVEY
jgi:uncharacterized protein YjdB